MQKLGKQPKSKPTHKHYMEGTSILDVRAPQRSPLRSGHQAFIEHKK